MIPLKQRNRHRPAEGIWGDCHRAAIASVLELPLDDVPNFGEGGPNGEEFARRERDWLKGVGLVPIQVPFDAALDQVFRCVRAINPDVYFLLGGRSRTGVNHTVVGFNDAIVHDPSLDDAGIVGPCEDGYFWVTFFGCICASRRSEQDRAEGPVSPLRQ